MAREQLPTLETGTAQKMAGKAYVANEPLLVDGQARENHEPGYDQFALTPEERKEYGIEAHEAHEWIRNPKYWENVEFKDRVSEWRRMGGGRRVILQNGQFVTNGDLVLVAKPREEKEREAALQQQATEEYLQTLESGDVGDIPRWRNDRESIEELKDRQHQQNIAAGLIGPTAGMDFDVVMRQFGRERVEKEMAFYRNGGRHVDATPRQESFAEAQEARQTRREKTSVGYNRKVAENWPADMQRKR